MDRRDFLKTGLMAGCVGCAGLAGIVKSKPERVNNLEIKIKVGEALADFDRNYDINMKRIKELMGDLDEIEARAFWAALVEHCLGAGACIYGFFPACGCSGYPCIGGRCCAG